MADGQLDELLEFLGIASISTLPEHRDDVRRAARWVAGKMESIGLATSFLETPGHPVVVGTFEADPSLPTVLFYGHYDVQPVDPLAEWHSPPFTPAVRDGRVYARGASDDKGPVLLHLQALEELRREGVPFNVIALVEGEEEIGSPNLRAVLSQQRDLFSRAGVAFVSDTTMLAEDVPSICTGLRGLLDLEITVQGPAQDLHSGLYGGAVANPLHALAALVASLHHPDGRVAVAGFYDRVRQPTRQEREELRALPFDEAAFLAATGSPALFGEEGYSTLERIWLRPTLEVNGLWGGFTGAGQKTIVPSRADAKITCRLVPDQDPEEIFGLVEAHLRAHTPPGVDLQVVRGTGTPGVVVPTDLVTLRLAARALQAVYGREPAFTRMGGSIPVVALFQELFGLPTLLVGFSLPDDGFHSPNEHFSLTDFRRGRETVKQFYRLLANTA